MRVEAVRGVAYEAEQRSLVSDAPDAKLLQQRGGCKHMPVVRLCTYPCTRTCQCT